MVTDGKIIPIQYSAIQWNDKYSFARRAIASNLIVLVVVKPLVRRPAPRQSGFHTGFFARSDKKERQSQ